MGRFVVVWALLASASWAVAGNAIESRTVHFARGESSTTLKGVLKGERIVDYRLRATAGQTMSVRLETSNLANYFNVLPPGSNDVAIFIGSSGGNEWRGPLAATGEYTIRVYLMRSAAWRNETARYTLSVGIAGSPATEKTLGAAPAGDARVKGTPYHATGQLPCSMGDFPAASAQCGFGVIRGKPGNAELHVTSPGGLERVLRFIDGKPATPGGDAIKASREDDMWLIEVNDYEHYRIPDAVIYGG